MNGIDLRHGTRLNVIWLAEASEQGRAAKTLFDLPDRGVALLDGNHRLVWRATSGTRRQVEVQVLKLLR